MKKETLFEIILGTIGGLLFAIGMCMCLIPEWALWEAGIVAAIFGFLILLAIIPVYRINHPKKIHGKIHWGMLLTWIIGIMGSIVMGFGMSKVMVENPDQTALLIGIGTGIIGLLICVLNYPIYSYLKGKKQRE